MSYISRIVKEVSDQMIYEKEEGEAALRALEAVSSLPTPVKEEMFVTLLMKERHFWLHSEKKLKVAA